jgi:hypothetical protein
MQSSWALRASNQLRTWPSGVLLTSSESTQVSSNYFTGRDPGRSLGTAQVPTVHPLGH